MPTFATCLWFDGNAEDVVKFYASIFEDVKIKATSYYGESGPGKPGTVLTIEFELMGQEFLALSGGPMSKFSPATSFMICCDSQAEVDFYWDKLAVGGQNMQCGWLQDKFGVSWQVVPKELPGLLTKGTKEQIERTMQAMMKMTKLDIKTLQQAHHG